MDSKEEKIEDVSDMAPVSNFRRKLPQILAVSAKNTLVFNAGLSLALPTVVIPTLTRHGENDIFMTTDQISWFGSLYFIIKPFSCLASGPLAHKFGRRAVMLALCAPLAGSWLLFACAYTPQMLFGGLVLQAIVHGLLEAPVLTYVAEVCDADVRGPLSSTTVLTALIGKSLQFLGANFFDWRTAAYICTAGPLVSFCCLLLVPESPHWLVAQKRMSDVESSLCWLRGWVPTSHIQEEVKLLRSSADADKSANPFAFAPYKDPTFFKPFALVVFTYFVGIFGGTVSLITYAVTVYEAIDSPLDPYVATTASGFLMFSGTIIFMLLLPCAGRRKLAVASMLLISVLLTFLAIADKGWAAMSLLLSIFLISTCVKILPWVFIGEVFTPGLRATASGMGTSIGYAMVFVVNKCWFIGLDLIGLRGMFICFAVVSLVGTAVFYFVLPETEGRTLEEVQAHFKGELDLVNGIESTKSGSRCSSEEGQDVLVNLIEDEKV